MEQSSNAHPTLFTSEVELPSSNFFRPPEPPARACKATIAIVPSRNQPGS
jgi:hypothetical protein